LGLLRWYLNDRVLVEQRLQTDRRKASVKYLLLKKTQFIRYFNVNVFNLSITTLLKHLA